MGFQLEVIRFISDQFAREKVSHHDYKISTAYADIVVNTAGVAGLAYPSVQTAYQGQNIVVPPRVVDESLRITALSVQRLHKFNEKMVLNNYKKCTNPSACAENIVWSDLDAKHVYTKEEIASGLDLNVLR